MNLKKVVLLLVAQLISLHGQAKELNKIQLERKAALDSEEKKLNQSISDLEEKRDNSYGSQGAIELDEKIEVNKERLKKVQRSLDAYEASFNEEFNNYMSELKSSLNKAAESVQKNVKENYEKTAEAASMAKDLVAEKAKQSLPYSDEISNMKKGINLLAGKEDLISLKSRINTLENRLNRIFDSSQLNKKIAQAIANSIKSETVCQAINNCDASVGSSDILKVIQKPNVKKTSSGRNHGTK